MRLLDGVRDSKQMSELGREIWFEKLRILEQTEGLRYVVVFSSAHYIDVRGIVPAVRAALARALRFLEARAETSSILLDGSLKAPARFVLQKTIIRGDETEPLISLASIAAKVRRDHRMIRLAKRFPEYGFDIHKGYGTKLHYEMLRLHGLSPIHRQSFIHI